ncbi:hypothetical protein GOV14_06120 [Candidatus Pacearchaeota archaeon]|nr:hypothetical protein [Candidatus Pacearchaeota archaeon]
MKTVMILVMFLLIGAFFIISNENLLLKDKESLDTFFVSYTQWLDQLLGNGKTFAGYVVKMQWLPEES